MNKIYFLWLQAWQQITLSNEKLIFKKPSTFVGGTGHGKILSFTIKIKPKH
jgi:hypothetical protein